MEVLEIDHCWQCFNRSGEKAIGIPTGVVVDQPKLSVRAYKRPQSCRVIDYRREEALMPRRYGPDIMQINPVVAELLIQDVLAQFPPYRVDEGKGQ